MAPSSPAPSSPVQTPLPSSGETSPSVDSRQRPTAANGHGQFGSEKGRGTPLRSVSTPVSTENDDDRSTNQRRPSISNDSDSDAGTGTETPRPFRPSLVRSNTSTRTMLRIPSQSVPPNGMGSRRPSDKSAHGENRRVNADDLFEREEDREARTQMDDFYKEFCVLIWRSTISALKLTAGAFPAINLPIPVGSLSISPSNRDVCLAS